MPEAPSKEGYTVKWNTVIDRAVSGVVVYAVYTEIPRENEPIDEPDTPETGDNGRVGMWATLALLSGGMLFGTILRKKKEAEK